MGLRAIGGGFLGFYMLDGCLLFGDYCGLFQEAPSSDMIGDALTCCSLR
jgi:hypothetical protein